MALLHRKYIGKICSFKNEMIALDFSSHEKNRVYPYTRRNDSFQDCLEIIRLRLIKDIRKMK